MSEPAWFLAFTKHLNAKLQVPANALLKQQNIKKQHNKLIINSFLKFKLAWYTFLGQRQWSQTAKMWTNG